MTSWGRESADQSRDGFACDVMAPMNCTNVQKILIIILLLSEICVKKLLFLVVNSVVLLPRRFSVEIHPDLLDGWTIGGVRKRVFFFVLFLHPYKKFSRMWFLAFLKIRKQSEKLFKNSLRCPRVNITSGIVN